MASRPKPKPKLPAGTADDGPQVRKVAREIAGGCLAVRARVLSRVISRLYDDALRPFELKASQLNVLVSVAVSQPAQPVQLARRLSMDASTLSRNLRPLVQRGWLRTTPVGPRAEQTVELTAEGAQLLNDLMPAWRKAQRTARARLGQENADALGAACEFWFHATSSD